MADADAERQRRREERDRKRREEEEKWELERKQREEERKQRKLAREASKMRILNEINEIESIAATEQADPETIRREPSSESVSEISSPELTTRNISEVNSPSEERSVKTTVPSLELSSSQEETGNPVQLVKSQSPKVSPRKLKQLELLQEEEERRKKELEESKKKKEEEVKKSIKGVVQQQKENLLRHEEHEQEQKTSPRPEIEITEHVSAKVQLHEEISKKSAEESHKKSEIVSERDDELSRLRREKEERRKILEEERQKELEEQRREAEARKEQDAQERAKREEEKAKKEEERKKMLQQQREEELKRKKEQEEEEQRRRKLAAEEEEQRRIENVKREEERKKIQQQKDLDAKQKSVLLQQHEDERRKALESDRAKQSQDQKNKFLEAQAKKKRSYQIPTVELTQDERIELLTSLNKRQLLFQINDERHKLLGELKVIQSQIDNLEPSKLQKTVAVYSSSYFQILERLLEGGNQEYASIGGQTWQDELDEFYFHWVEPRDQSFVTVLSNWASENHGLGDKKLVGAMQFKRFIEEIKVISSCIKLPSMTRDEILAATGRNKVNYKPNYVWAACDIAQEKTREAIKPLVKQIAQRATLLLKRQGQVAETILAGSFGRRTGDTLTQISPFFKSYIKEVFSEFADQLAQQFISQCFDEFYTTKTIYWNYSLENNKIINESDIEKLAGSLFDNIKTRIFTRLMLMVCNFFVFSVTNKMHGFEQIQCKIHSLNELQLEDLFGTTRLRQDLEERERSVMMAILKDEEKEKVLMNGFLLNGPSLLTIQ